MPIDHKRRIFRRSARASGKGARLALGLTCATGGLAAAAFVLLEASPSLFGRTQPGPALLAAQPSQVAVIDGATLRLSDTVVRLAGVQAPARGVQCRAADGGRLDCGERAAAELARLVRAQTVTCLVAGRDVAGRPLVGCEAGGESLNRAVVASGWARSFGGDDALSVAEDEARSRHQGLWNGIYPEP